MIKGNIEKHQNALSTLGRVKERQEVNLGCFAS
jgi:hypothetical protein